MKILVQTRDGQKAKDLNKQGLIPAIVYGKHIQSPLAIACKRNDFIKRYKEAGYSTPITLHNKEIDQMVLIQEIQLDPITDAVIHIDFLAVSKDEKVTTEVPVILIGEAPVAKLGEGKVQLLKDFIEVEAFPQDLPHDIKIDISKIEKLHDTIFVKDLKVSDKVRIIDDGEQPIITVLSLAEEEAETSATPAEGTAAPAAAPTAPAAK